MSPIGVHGPTVLVASGAYLVSYWLPAGQHGSGHGRIAIGLPDTASAWLSRLLDGHGGLFAILGAMLALGGVGTAARHRLGRAAADVPAGTDPDGDCC